MADTKISDLSALTGNTISGGDYVPIVDVSDTSMAASGTNKRANVGVVSPLRVWVKFDGASNADNVSGTYSRTGTTVSVAVTGHNVQVGHYVFADFTSGVAVDGGFVVTVVTDANNFQFTHGTSGSTSGNITLRRNTLLAGQGVAHVTDFAVGSHVVNFDNAFSGDYGVCGTATSTAGGSTGRWLQENSTIGNTTLYCAVQITNTVGLQDTINTVSFMGV